MVGLGVKDGLGVIVGVGVIVAALGEFVEVGSAADKLHDDEISTSMDANNIMNFDFCFFIDIPL